jgi:hypothetical protein
MIVDDTIEENIRPSIMAVGMGIGFQQTSPESMGQSRRQ